MDEEITTLQQETEKAIYEEAGAVFNINSGKQKGEILFDKLKLPSTKTTKGGGRSTDTEVLKELAGKGYKIAELLTSYSELQKLQSGYTRSIPALVDYDGRLRCNFQSDGTRTGRFSSSNPNLQNQPNNKRFPIRKAFVASVGMVLGVADYSQIELRVMGHISKDKRFVDAFNHGEDIHGKVASDIGIERRQAKVVNFGILYGMGAGHLSSTIGVTETKAKKIVRDYEKTYSGYYEWRQLTEKRVQQNKSVRTITGRIRRLPDITSENRARYFGALRQGCNTIIQGSAADIIKIAMINIHRRFKEEGEGAKILMQVHDELICEFPKHRAEHYYQLMCEEMQSALKLIVPLEVDGKICENWAQMKDDNYKYKNQNNFPIWLI